MISVSKKIIGQLEKCYCVAPLDYKGEQHFLVAAEKINACLLFNREFVQVEEVWKEPGGTMSIVQIPGSDGDFLATQYFYSPNDSEKACIVYVSKRDGEWTAKNVCFLPHVHRFDILHNEGKYYLIACTICSRRDFKDDWAYPGKVYACELPDSFDNFNESNPLPLEVIKEGMLKNHGYTHYDCGDHSFGVVSCEQGVFRFTPPNKEDGQWTVDVLLSSPASDALLMDLDGDGKNELISIAPFHGNELVVYKMINNQWQEVYRHDEDLEFLHAICEAKVRGENVAIIGFRKGKRELLCLYCKDGKYGVYVLDSDVGPANVLYSHVDGRDILLSANREIDEIAVYELL